MSHADANQTVLASQAYRRLGLKPITSQYKSGARAFTKQRHKIAAQDERLAFLKEESIQDPRLDPEVSFPFMDLPAEIRVRVYQYALTRSRRLHLEVTRTPALACVSKHIRQECLPVFLRVNSFQAYYSRGLDGTFGIDFANENLAWLMTMPLTAKLIQNIQITYQGDLGQGGPRSIKFLVVANSSRTFVNHVEKACPFCIDGWYGEYYKLPHPAYDHPSFAKSPFKMKDIHDEFVKEVETAYFRKSADWGRGGLSITDVINLAGAADSIKKDPALFRPFCLSMQKMIDDAYRVVAWATDWTELMAERRVQQEALEEAGGPRQADPVEQWLQSR